MSHLTTSSNTKTDAGAPGPTGTSPGQAVGSDKIQDQSNTHQDHKQTHSDSSKKSESSPSSHDEKHSKSDSMDLLDTSKTTTSTKSDKESLPSGETDPGVTASNKTEAGAGTVTGKSPGEAFGSDESRDESPKHHDHHNHHNHNHSEKENKPAGETDPGVTANTKTEAGAGTVTGKSPGEAFCSDESRDESPKHHDHHKHHNHSHNHSEKENKPSGKTDPGVTASAKTEAGASTATGTSAGEAVGSDESRHKSPKHHEHHEHHEHHNKSLAKKENVHEGSETDPGVTASSKTESGAPGPTGTAPGEGIGSDETRDESPKHHDHHKHHEHQKTDSHDSKALSSTDSSSKPSHTSTSETGMSKKSADGFDGPNASFTSEIGSKNDPGRLAEKEMYEKNAQTGDVGSMGVKQGSITGGGQYDVLNREETA